MNRNERCNNCLLTSLAQLCTFSAVPFALWPILSCQAHTIEMKPLNGTVFIVTCDHLTKGDTLTVAIHWLIVFHWWWDCWCHTCKTQQQNVIKPYPSYLMPEEERSSHHTETHAIEQPGCQCNLWTSLRAYLAKAQSRTSESARTCWISATQQSLTWLLSLVAFNNHAQTLILACTCNSDCTVFYVEPLPASASAGITAAEDPVFLRLFFLTVSGKWACRAASAALESSSCSMASHSSNSVQIYFERLSLHIIAYKLSQMGQQCCMCLLLYTAWLHDMKPHFKVLTCRCCFASVFMQGTWPLVHCHFT